MASLASRVGGLLEPRWLDQAAGLACFDGGEAGGDGAGAFAAVWLGVLARDKRVDEVVDDGDVRRVFLVHRRDRSPRATARHVLHFLSREPIQADQLVIFDRALGPMQRDAQVRLALPADAAVGHGDTPNSA